MNINERAITAARDVWGWTDIPETDDRLLLTAYNRRFQEVERLYFPNPPQPWLESYIALAQTPDGRWTYRFKLEMYNNGCGGGWNVIVCKPYPDKISAIEAAIKEAHTWLSRNVFADLPETEETDDDELGSHTYTKNERKLETALRAWLTSLTEPAQMRLF